MGTLALGMASSHAFALTEPALWDQVRLRNRKVYERRYGVLPPEQPQVADETDAVVRERFGAILDAHAALQAQLTEARPDVIVLIGDDQNENFVDTNPQFAIYVGDDFDSGPLSEAPERRRSHRALAEAILTGCVAADIDIASVRKLPDNRLFGHAFGPLLRRIDPDNNIPCIPIFVNAIHMPAPSPGRCYYVGQTIRRIVERCGDVGRVVVCGSGGLSHFTAGFPWPHHTGTSTYGSIDQQFDAWLLERMAQGEGTAIARLTTDDLLEHGEIELRSWIVVLGALGDVKPELLVYVPLYRGLLGMGVAAWRV